MSRYTLKSLRRLMRELRRDFPLQYQARVRRVKLGNLEEMGDCRMTKGGCFIIRLNLNTPVLIQRDTLMHEWAHARVWHARETVSHRAEWANEYGRIMRWSQCEDEYGSQGGCVHGGGS